MQKKTIYDVDVRNKKIYLRTDYNVPHNEYGITDDRRIRATIPTLRYLIKEGASIVIASHMGRPKGEVKRELSLKPVAERLSELLGQKVYFADDCIGEEVEIKKSQLKQGEVLLLENLRFHTEEEKNDSEFVEQLIKGCELAVNDAFGVSHRMHASIAGVGKKLPMVAGLLLKKEIDFLGGLMESPERPFAAII
ncbi:MAG: phosphoglycerate kinase, partial [Dialister micraerophilus]|nr:phosphoglycerate kinase [Dialister micraerophilus]